MSLSKAKTSLLGKNWATNDVKGAIPMNHDQEMK